MRPSSTIESKKSWQTVAFFQTCCLGWLQFISGFIDVISGVGQGSHLGPLLFWIYFNDIGQVIKFCNFLIFADDLKVYEQIFTALDVAFLKLDLQSIFLWLVANGFSTNARKCLYVIFSRIFAASVDYAIDGVSLVRKESV